MIKYMLEEIYAKRNICPSLNTFDKIVMRYMSIPSHCNLLSLYDNLWELSKDWDEICINTIHTFEVENLISISDIV
jgi:hypothetical protein